jgi:hypothetical protein
VHSLEEIVKSAERRHREKQAGKAAKSVVPTGPVTQQSDGGKSGVPGSARAPCAPGLPALEYLPQAVGFQVGTGVRHGCIWRERVTEIVAHQTQVNLLVDHV